MLDYSIVGSLFNLNFIISIIRRKAILETIVKRVVVDACKSHKFLERKSRAKMLLLSTNIVSLLSFSIYISFVLLAIVAKLAITSYTIY